MEYRIRITGTGTKEELISNMVKVASFLYDNPDKVNDDEKFVWVKDTLSCKIEATENEDMN